MFSFTNKKVTDVWNSEVDSMKKISKMADLQVKASWCITTRVRIRQVMSPLVLPHRLPLYFLDLSKQFKQNTCNIQFIKSFHLKYGIYKPREVVNPIKQLVRKRTRFFIGFSTSLGL